MSTMARARKALRIAVRWERETLGVGPLMPAAVRHGLRRIIGYSPGEARRFIPAGTSTEGLFRELARRDAAYVVLRWFDPLPSGPPDGDIDFLVADESLATFAALLVRDKEGVPCDVYSESGAVGYRYERMPYLQPQLARGLLARRTTMSGVVSIPCPEDHFLSLAYHAVYQKGLLSGLPTSISSLQPLDAPAHDYRGTLARLADGLGLAVPISMEGLDRHLAERGWRPPEAVLARLAAQNVWIRHYFGDAGRGRSTR